MHSPELIEKIRRETESLGLTSLKTVEDVDNFMKVNDDKTVLVFVNSMCGCASATARPALKSTIPKLKVDSLITVFAGQDSDATAKMREYLKPFSPSSPAFYLLKNGKPAAAIERHEILHHDPQEVAEKLVKMTE